MSRPEELTVEWLEAIGYPAEICENVRLLIVRAERAEADRDALKSGLQWIADNTTEAHIHHSAATLLADTEEKPCPPTQ